LAAIAAVWRCPIQSLRLDIGNFHSAAIFVCAKVLPANIGLFRRNKAVYS
jgi:hypothetical protein